MVSAAEDPELVIEPLEHRHDPSTGAFQEGHLQLRVPFADAAEHEEADRHLDVEHVRQALLEREARHDVRHAIGETQQLARVRHVGWGDGWIPIGQPNSAAARQNGSKSG